MKGSDGGVYDICETVDQAPHSRTHELPTYDNLRISSVNKKKTEMHRQHSSPAPSIHHSSFPSAFFFFLAKSISFLFCAICPSNLCFNS